MQRMALVGLIGLALLTGCQQQGATVPQLDSPRVADDAAVSERPLITLGENRAEVRNLAFGVPNYIWSGDEQQVYFAYQNGIWAISPDGKQLEAVVVGGGSRDLIAPWKDGLLYWEYREHDSALMYGHKAQPPQVVATLSNLDPRAGVSRWTQHFLLDDSVYAFGDGLRPVRIQLQSGNVTELGDMPYHNNVLVAVAPTAGIATLKDEFSDQPVRILNLTTGAQSMTEGSHFGRVSWSPADTRWAVRVATTAGAKAAGAVDVGDAAGRVQRVSPREPLALISGPFWSPDGRQLAMEAQVGGAAGSPTRETAIWVVTLTPSGTVWNRVAGLVGTGVVGWHPEGTHLVLFEPGPGSRTGRTPVAGGPIEWLRSARDPGADAVDQRLFVVSSSRQQGFPFTQLGRQIPVQIGYPTEDNFKLYGGYASWLSPERSLVIQRL